MGCGSYGGARRAGNSLSYEKWKEEDVEVSVEDDERMVKKRHEFEEYKRRKMTLIATILEAIGIEIRDKLMARPKFDELVRGGDAIAFLQLVERVVQGTGTVSIFHIIIRFLNMKMTNGATAWATYFKEWKEVALRRQGTDREILEAIMQTQFVLSLDQDMFKDQLTSIYGSTTWPTTDEMIARLSAFATNDDVIRTIGETDGRVGAFRTKETPWDIHWPATEGLLQLRGHWTYQGAVPTASSKM